MLRRRDDGSVPREAQRSGKHPRDGRARDRAINGGVWDDEGRYWELRSQYLSRSQVESLLGAIPVGVQNGYGTKPDFYDAASGRRLWAERLCNALADGGDLDTGGWPKQVAYLAEVASRPDGTRLLWFGGQC